MQLHVNILDNQLSQIIRDRLMDLAETEIGVSYYHGTYYQLARDVAQCINNVSHKYMSDKVTHDYVGVDELREYVKRVAGTMKFEVSSEYFGKLFLLFNRSKLSIAYAMKDVVNEYISVQKSCGDDDELVHEIYSRFVVMIIMWCLDT